MSILNVKLFLGMHLDSALKEAISLNHPDFVKLFLNHTDAYLFTTIFEDQKYLGKFIDSGTSLADLQLSQNNLLSIAKKLAPNYPFNPQNTVLFVNPSEK